MAWTSLPRFAVLALIGLVLAVTLPRIWLRIQTARGRRAFRMDEAPRWARNPALKNISNLPVFPFMSQARIQELTNGSFLHRSSDVWVVSYPKSGTTWVQAIVVALLGDGGGGGSLEGGGLPPEELKRRCPWPERALGVLAYNAVPLEAYSRLPAPRCLKSHWRAQDHHLSKGRGRVLYVMRNVLDVAASYFPHYSAAICGLAEETDTSLDTFWRLFRDGDVMSGSYFDHIASWWPHREDPDVLIVRYEDLKSEPGAEIQKIASFLGLGPLPDGRLSEVLAATSFKHMQRLEKERFWPWLTRILGIRGQVKMRSGQIGEGKVLLTREYRAEMERQYDALLAPLGVPRAFVLLPP